MLRQAAILLTPSARVQPDEWGAANRTYGASTGLPGPRRPELTAYLIPFARAVHSGGHRRVVAVTAAQSGKTEGLLDILGARLDQRPAPILYVGPSKDFVTDQFEPRLMGLLDEAPTLSAKVVRGRAMKKTLKYIAGVRVRLGSAGSSTSLKSDSFALGLVDEYDEMVANIKGQGDPLGLVEARGELYSDFVTAVTSTPSVGLVDTEQDAVSGLEFWAPGEPEQIESPIWRLWQGGTRHHFAWACPHCGGYFVPRFGHLQWPKGSTPAQAQRGAFLLCPAEDCGGVIEEGHKAAMIAGGVQIAPGQTIEEARVGANEPDNTVWSCWTSGLCSPFVTFGQRAASYLQALETGEPDKMQTVMNANFGECHSPISGGDHPEWEEVRARALPYAEGEVPAGGLRLLMAVDVQRFSLIYVIRAFGSRGTSWLVSRGQLYGPTDQDEVWSALTDLMMTPVAGMVIERVAVDSGFRPNKPRRGERAQGLRVRPPLLLAGRADEGQGRPEPSLPGVAHRGEAGRQAPALQHQPDVALDRLLQEPRVLPDPHSDGRARGLLRPRRHRRGLLPADRQRGPHDQGRQAGLGGTGPRQPFSRLRGDGGGARLRPQRAANPGRSVAPDGSGGSSSPC